MSIKWSIKQIIKTLLSLALGVVILWMLYRRTDMTEMWRIVSEARWEFILLSLFFGLMGNILRGLRWELLLQSLGYQPARKTVVYATLGNYAVNFLFPRAGDVWRCGVVSRTEQIPFGKCLETFLVDKVLEIVAFGLLLIATFLLSIDFFLLYFDGSAPFAETITNVMSSGWFWGGLVLCLVGIALGFTVFKKTFVIQKIVTFYQTIKRDMRRIWQMKSKKRVIIYTFLSWLAFYLYFYICFYAFDFMSGLGPLTGLIVFAMSNIGVAVPVQGGIGTWHFMVISSLTLLGIAHEQAQAFAGAVFAIQSVWIILCGVYCIVALPNRRTHTTASANK